MDNQTVLTKVIEKAEANGFDVRAFMEAPGEPTQWQAYDNGVITLPLARGGRNAVTLEKLIFDHQFCKALWGNNEHKKIMAKHKAEREKGHLVPRPPQYVDWQLHLMQMAVAKDRIAYLKDNAGIDND